MGKSTNRHYNQSGDYKSYFLFETMPLNGLNQTINGQLSIKGAIDSFIESVSRARSANTARTYKNGLAVFLQVLAGRKIDPDEVPVSDLKEDAVVWLIDSLKDLAPTTERLYVTALASFYEYLSAENLASINLPRLKMLIKQRARRPGVRLPQFPRDDIDKILDYVTTLTSVPVADETEHLRNLRDRSFLLMLADTGLRVHEACNLRRGDVDWNEGRAIIIGKGNRQAVVRFSRRCQQALKDYLSTRAALDGLSGRPLTALPLFARHDKGAGKKIKPITTATGRNIVKERVAEAIGPQAVGSITPHSFRHYFVTRVLLSSGNLKLAQELARHKNIAVTQRYAHLTDDELDQGYWEVFEE
jgi:integrase/recombinase XerC